MQIKAFITVPDNKEYYSVIKNTTNSRNLYSTVYPSMQAYLNEKHRFLPANKLIHGDLSTKYLIFLYKKEPIILGSSQDYQKNKYTVCTVSLIQ